MHVASKVKEKSLETGPDSHPVIIVNGGNRHFHHILPFLRSSASLRSTRDELNCLGIRVANPAKAARNQSRIVFECVDCKSTSFLLPLLSTSLFYRITCTLSQPHPCIHVYQPFIILQVALSFPCIGNSTVYFCTHFRTRQVFRSRKVNAWSPSLYHDEFNLRNGFFSCPISS